MEIRCRGGIDFYGAGGRLQLVVREVDPVFTLGMLERRRRETLAALEAAGLLEVNRGLALPPLPLTVALVTSEGSAAYHDFVATLGESGYGFRVLLVHAAVQGRGAERELTSALTLAGRAGFGDPRRRPRRRLRGADPWWWCEERPRGLRQPRGGRGGGALRRPGADRPRPRDRRSIADRVAHTALKTPTKVAELLIERVAASERALSESRRAVAAAARERLRDGRESLGSAERGVELARTRLTATAARLAEHARTLTRVARARLRGAEGQREQTRRRLTARVGWLLARRRAELPAGRLRRAGTAVRHRLRRLEEHQGERARRLSATSRRSLRELTARLAAAERLVHQLAPARLLERGYSITRTPSGDLLTDPRQAPPGTRITTETARGTLTSEVEETPA